MRDGLRQILVAGSVLLTLVVNGMANALPINGVQTGEVSDQYRTLFTPAGFTFSIWGVIYLGLIAYTVFQALPAQRTNPRLRATGGWVILSCLANAGWIFLWHYQQFLLTLVLMLVLLGALIQTYLGLNPRRGGRVSNAERWAVRLPFSIYLGWVSVATVANASVVLVRLGWDGAGLSPETWMMIVLAVVAALAALMSFSRRDVGYALVFLWALYGISARHGDNPGVLIPVWVTFGLVLLGLLAALWRGRRSASAA